MIILYSLGNQGALRERRLLLLLVKTPQDSRSRERSTLGLYRSSYHEGPCLNRHIRRSLGLKIRKYLIPALTIAASLYSGTAYERPIRFNG